MSEKFMYPGQAVHPGTDGWKEEIQETRNIQGWRENLINRVRATLGPNGDFINRVGYKINETQIQYHDPINALFSFKPLGIYFAQFNTWDAVTKKAGTKFVRVSPNTACLLVLVKVPDNKGGYNFYFLARKKDQFAAQTRFTEISRGFNPGVLDSEMGWFLFDRDFPAFRKTGQFDDAIEGIYHTQLGQGVLEDTAQQNNSIFYHIVVVTLKNYVSKEQLQALLVKGSVEKQFGDNPDYPDLDALKASDLITEPVVFELAEAVSIFDKVLSNEKDETKPYFKEQYSVNSWLRFVNAYGHQFPEITSRKETLPI
jgi:hypothetical protein